MQFVMQFVWVDSVDFFLGDQAFAVPAAPPPSPSVPHPQMASFETVAPAAVPSVPSPRGVVSPVSQIMAQTQSSTCWDVPGRGYVSQSMTLTTCTTSSPLLRVRSVEPPRTKVMVTPQHRTVPRLDLGKVRRWRPWPKTSSNSGCRNM